MELTITRELEESLEEFDITELLDLEEQNKIILFEFGFRYFLIWYEQSNGKYEISKTYQVRGTHRDGQNTYVTTQKRYDINDLDDDMIRLLEDKDSKRYCKTRWFVEDLKKYLNDEDIRENEGRKKDIKSIVSLFE